MNIEYWSVGLVPKDNSRLAQLRKAKGLQLGKVATRISDLKVAQLAIIVGQTHPVLTSQTLFALGGELVELHRNALASMKRQEDGSETSLTMRIKVSKRMGWSEKRWRDRLLEILFQGQWGSREISHTPAFREFPFYKAKIVRLVQDEDDSSFSLVAC